MSNVKDILHNKGDEVISIGKSATVMEAALLMNKHKIGALVVLDEDKLNGIFTERDVLRRVVVEKKDPEKTKVTEVMTTDVACCRPQTSIEEARTVMKNHRIRHLPVVLVAVDDGVGEGRGTVIDRDQAFIAGVLCDQLDDLVLRNAEGLHRLRDHDVADERCVHDARDVREDRHA